ncbi:MAG: hypothetical protein P8L75_04750 [Gammaproteobacteria bacterium]|jgi:hypothetical protein|nr:hypothetical protein [Gammaproteobacteria bacterium]|tara:strand:- start:195 stop:485 length:291 start_codon:yes stop_codon:yes gene_type:complete
MKHISKILQNDLGNLNKISESLDQKTTILKSLKKNMGALGQYITDAYLEKNNVLIIESINPEVSSKIRFEEIRIKKLCEQIGFVPKKIKCLVKKGY